MSTVSKKKNIKRYGIWQEETARHGKCWCFKISWFDLQGKKHRKRQSGFKTKEEAQQVFDEIKRNARLERMGVEVPGVFTRRKMKATIVSQAIKAYIKVKEDERVARRISQNPNARWHRGQLDLLYRWETFAGGDNKVRDIKEDHLKAWTAHEVQRGLQLSSVSRSLNTIRACLNHAQQNNEDLENYKVPKKPLKRKETDFKRERFLDSDEIKKLSETLSSQTDYRDAFDFFRIALGTASRMDEILGLRWRDVDFKNNIVKLYASKTRKEKNLYIPAVVEIITARKKANLGSETHVFACRDHRLRKVFNRVSVSCGMPYGQRSSDPNATPWSIHDLRRTALTNLLANNVDLATVSRDWAQHEDITETTRYLMPTALSKKLATDASNALVNLATP